MNFQPGTMSIPVSMKILNADRSPPGRQRSDFQFLFKCKKLVNGKRVDALLKFNLDCFREEFKGSYGSAHKDTIIDYRDIHCWRGEENGVMVEYGRGDTIDHYETSQPDKILLAVQKIMEERKRREKIQPGSVHGRRLSMTAQKVMDDLNATDPQEHADGLEIFSDEIREPATWDDNANMVHARRRTSLLSGLANISLNINKAIAAEPNKEHARKMSTTDMSMVVQAAIGRNGTNKTIAEHDTKDLSASRSALQKTDSIPSFKSGQGSEGGSQMFFSNKPKSDIWSMSGYTEESDGSYVANITQPSAEGSESEKKSFKMPTAPASLKRTISSSTNALKKRMSSNKPPQINPSRALNRQRSEVFLRSQGRQRSDTVLSLKRSVSPMPSRTDKAVEDLSESSELMTRASSNARLSTTMSGIGLRRTASMLELDAAMADQDFAEVRFDDEKLDPDSAAKSSCDGGSFGGLPSIPSVTNMANVSKEVEGADTEPHNDFHVTGGRSTMQMAGAPPDLSPKAVGNVTTRSVGTETKTRFVNPLDQPKSSSEMVFICRAKNPSKDYALRDVKLSISRTTGEIRLYNMEEKEIGLIFPHKVRKLSSTPATVTFHFKDKKKMLLYTPEGDVIEDRITVILKSLGHYIEVDQKGPSNIIDLPFGLR